MSEKKCNVSDMLFRQKEYNELISSAALELLGYMNIHICCIALKYTRVYTLYKHSSKKKKFLFDNARGAYLLGTTFSTL